MIIPGQFGFNCLSGFREEVFWNIFPIGSNVKLSPAVASELCIFSSPFTFIIILFSLTHIFYLALSQSEFPMNNCIIVNLIYIL